MQTIQAGSGVHGGMWRAWLAVLLLLALAGCGGDDPPPPPPPSVGSATIDAAGGTVNGPDGVQLVVPPDALSGPVTIRIARNAAGAPALPAEAGQAATYEITPHDLAFAFPIQVRLPLAASAGASPVAMAASPGGTWATVPATFSDGVATIERATLSYFSGWACSIQAGNTDPYPCVVDSVVVTDMTTTPAGGYEVIPWPGNVVVRAFTAPVTARYRLSFSSARDCSGGQLTVRRIEVPVGGPARPTQVELAGQSITLTPSVSTSASTGTFDFVTQVSAAQSGTLTFGFDFTCTRSYQSQRRFATSYDSRLVRIAPPPAAPTITQQPASAAVTAGSAASFTVLASGAATLTYAWERSNDNGATWQALGTGTAVAGGSSFGLTAALADDRAQFRAQVCMVAGAQQTCIASNPALLTVTPAAVAPSFTTQPTGLMVVAGQTASFSAVASGTPAPTVRWQVAAPGSSTFADVGGEPACAATPAPGSGAQTTSTCTLAPTVVGLSGSSYRALAVNAAAPAGVPSSAATLTVNTAPMAPAITTPPAPQSTTASGSATFTVVATGTAPLAYQWRVNGVDLTGPGPFTIGNCTGSADFAGAGVTLSNLSAGCSGAGIEVVVSNGTPPDATSAPVTLTVLPAVSSVGGCFGGATGWCYVQPSPNANILRALAFTSTGELVVGGDVGTFQRSTDFGSSWTLRWTINASNERHGWWDLALPTDSRIVAISEGSGINGTASAPSGIYVSDNGGATWTLAQAEDFLSSVAFQDANVGVALSGGFGRIWRTTNGGSTWTQQTVAPVGVVEFTRVVHAGGTVFVAVGQGGAIWRSADSGLNWSSVTSGVTDALVDVAFNGAGIGLAVRAGQTQLLRSADFGVSWQSVNIPMSASTVGFASATVAAVLGDISSESIRSTDAGVTWSSPNFDLSSGQQNWRMRFANATTGIAVGAYGAVARTTNGGQSWTRIAGGTAFDRVEDLQASPDRSVVLGAIGGEVKRSVDGGRTWSDPASGRRGMNGFSWGSNTVALGFVSSVGLYRTDDAGQSWAQVLALPPNTTSRAVAMASATVALAARHPSGAGVGQGGVLERTTDGGNTWAPVSLPGASDFWVVVARFASSTLGYVGGTGLWRTTNGGANWTRLTLPAPSSGVEFVSDIHVTPGGVLFVVTGDAVLRSTDQGATFTSVLDNQLVGLIRRIAFVDTNVGLGVGTGGIYRTSDAGLTWTRLDLPLNEAMWSVAWAAADTALVGGESAALLRNQAIGQLAAPPGGRVLRQSVPGRPTASTSKAGSGARSGAAARPPAGARAPSVQ